MKSLLDSERITGLGPLGAHVGTYLALLEKQGYKRPTIYPDTRLLADLGHWMRRNGRTAADLTESMIERFMSIICGSEVRDGYR